MKALARISSMFVVAILTLPVMSEAGPPLICHPFETEGGELLAWGPGPGWNSPDPNYDVRHLTRDVVSRLSPEIPVLTRMENLRRAVIYASRDRQGADALLAAVLARVDQARDARALAHARFDAGYLIESFRQAAHLHRMAVPPRDGYRMVVDASAALGGQAEMEFAAALMSKGTRATDHLRRARSAARPASVLARNIDTLGW